MLEFWSERAQRFGTDPRANANDVWVREIEIRAVAEVIARCAGEKDRVSVLDFGCANGFSSLRLADMFPEVDFTAVDINPDMIANAKAGLSKAGLENLAFRCADVLKDDFGHGFDVIYAIRVFQNMDSLQTQKRYAQALIGLLAPGGRLLFIESYADGYERLNRDRAELDLPPLPLHPHLTRLTDAFDEFLGARMKSERKDNPFSSYHLITRLVYSWYAREMGEDIDYDHPLHRVAAVIPSLGDYGPLRLRVYRKP
ncbi:MAG: class I SAM-dependent methyltransferase [Alphaproteobacteria bacterium]